MDRRLLLPWILMLVLENLADGAMTWEGLPPSQEAIAVDLTKTNPCGNSIYTFTVKDADDSPTYSITQNPDGKFIISEDKLYCTDVTLLRNNGYSSYTLTVTITDGTTPLTDTFTVTIIGLPTTTTQTTVASTTQTTVASTTQTTVASTTQTTMAFTTQTSTASTTQTSTFSTTPTSTASTTPTSTFSTTPTSSLSTTPTSTNTTLMPDVLPLLLVLGLGIGLTLIFMVVVAVILRKKQRSKGDNRFSPSQNPLPVQTQL